MHIREYLEVIAMWILHIGHEFMHELKQLLWPD